MIGRHIQAYQLNAEFMYTLMRPSFRRCVQCTFRSSEAETRRRLYYPQIVSLNLVSASPGEGANNRVFCQGLCMAKVLPPPHEHATNQPAYGICTKPTALIGLGTRILLLIGPTGIFPTADLTGIAASVHP